MATREIKTKIAIDGEKEYKNAVKSINSELGTLKSEMKLVETQYAGQLNSYEALSAKGKILAEQYKAQQEKLEPLQKALSEYKTVQEKFSQQAAEAQENIERCNKALSELENTEGDTSKEQAELTAELEKWKSKLTEAESAQDKATQKVNSYQTQVNNTETDIAKLGQELDKNNSYLEEAANNSDGLATSINGLGKEVDVEKERQKAANEEEKKHAEQMEKLGNVAKATGAALAAAFTAMAALTGKVASELVDMTVAGAAYADEVLTTSTTTGIATDKLQGYMYASDLLDVSLETLTGSMTKNLKAMDSARDGSAAYVAAYEQLGIAVTDTDGNLRDSEAVYWEVIDALGNIENTSERDALAMQLLGKSAKDLNPLIEQGSERMNELAEEAEAAGYILSGDTLDAYGELQDNLDRLSRRAEGAKNALGTALLPTLTRLSGAGSDLLGNFTNAIKECDGDLGKMGAVVGDTLKEFVGIITEYTPEIVSLAEGIISGLVGGILEAAPALVQAVADLLPEIGNAIIAAVPLLNDAAVSIVTTLIEGIIAVIPTLLEAGAQMLTGIIEGIAGALPELIPAAVEAVTQLVEALLDNIPLIIDAALQLITGLADGIIAAIPVLLEALPEVIESLVDTLLDAIPQIIETGVKLLVALVENLPEIIETIIAVLPEIIESVITTLLDHIPEIIDAGVELFIALIENLPLIITTILKAIPQIITSVINALINSIPKIVETGVKLLVSLIQKLPQIISEIVRAMPQIINSITSALSQGISKVSEVGANLVRGLWNGIQSLAGWLWDKVSSWISSIWDGITGFFGIASPSKKMAWAGEMLVEGEAQGIERNAPKAVKAAENMSADMLAEVEDGIGKVNAELASSLGELETSIDARATVRQVSASLPALDDRRSAAAHSGGGDTTITNEFKIDKLVVREEADVKKVAKELYNMQRTKSRGKGVVMA